MLLHPWAAQTGVGSWPPARRTSGGTSLQGMKAQESWVRSSLYGQWHTLLSVQSAASSLGCPASQTRAACQAAHNVPCILPLPRRHAPVT